MGVSQFCRHKLKEIGGFEDVPMGQEFYLMLKAIEENLKIAYFATCDVVAYRHNDGGVSFGSNKIEGEKQLYNFKKTYFHLFSFRERMFIRFRHRIVMAIAYMRNKSYIRALLYIFGAIIASPLDFIKEAFSFSQKLLRLKWRNCWK